MKYPFKQITAVIMLSLFLLLMASFFVSCVSRKKQLEKTKSEIETKRKLDSAYVSKTSTSKEVKHSGTSTNTSKEKIIEYEGKAGDSLKVIEKGPDGKVIAETIITGTGKGTVKQKESTSNKIIDKVEAFIETIDSKATVKLEELHKERAEAKKLDVEKSGPSILFYIWITIIIAAIAGGWYLNKRFNVFARIKSKISKYF